MENSPVNNDMNNNGDNHMNKKVIVDLIEKMEYDVSGQQLEELSACARPLTQAEFVDYRRQLDELDLESDGASGLGAEVLAQLRALLRRVSEATREIGGRVVRIGKRIIKFVLEMTRRYPRTAKALVIMAALSFLVGQIPLIRHVLVPIVQGVGMVIAGFIFINEYFQKAADVDQGL